MRSGGQFSTRISESVLSRTNVPSEGVIRRLMLFDFITGHSDIRQNHHEAIQRHIVPLLNQGGLHVWVAGLASRLGSRGLNETLARSRARRVARRIEHMTTAGFGLQSTSFGERHSTHGSENSQYSRAVLIVVTRTPPIDIPQRPTTQHRRLFFNKFKICMGMGGDYGEGIVGANYTFFIDYDNRDPDAPRSNEQKYKFSGGGVGAGAPASESSGHGVWNYFALPNHRTAMPQSFAGNARIESVSVQFHEVGFGFMNVHLSPDHQPGVDIMPFDTRQSVSLSASFVTGSFSKA